MLSETRGHDDFLELCAFAASGQLTADEHERLQEHLPGCASCREAMAQYRAIVDHAIPAITAKQTPQYQGSGSGWSSGLAEQALFERIAREDRSKESQAEDAAGRVQSTGAPRVIPFRGEKAWRRVWLLYAAGILLSVALGLSAYQVGIRHSTTGARVVAPQPDLQKESALEEQLSDAGHERELAQAEIRQRDRTIADLRQELAQATAALRQTIAAQERLDREATAQGTATRDQGQQRTELAQRLSETQSKADALQKKLDSLQQQSAQDVSRTNALEAEVGTLTQQLHEQEVTVDQQQELLAHDRDIRELMGARDLYIAEVYDVGKTGTTQKPYGRMFYTKGKSLIFYAYDLDQQAQLKNARTFQAWGRRGPDPQQALNLGIFYVDNAAKKRWVLKFDDPKRLAQIDAVFVTVEPNGGSHKPSGQPLLFTYLKVEPNHP